MTSIKNINKDTCMYDKICKNFEIRQKTSRIEKNPKLFDKIT